MRMREARSETVIVNVHSPRGLGVDQEGEQEAENRGLIERKDEG